MVLLVRDRHWSGGGSLNAALHFVTGKLSVRYHPLGRRIVEKASSNIYNDQIEWSHRRQKDGFKAVTRVSSPGFDNYR